MSRVLPAFLYALGLAAVALPGLVAAAPPGTALPQRNLLVEVRQGDESSFTASGGGLRDGVVTVGPNGQVSGRAGVTLESRSGDRSGDAQHRLLVLNGGQGMLNVGASVPLTWLEVVWTPSGPGAIAGSSYVDTGRSVAVRPRWPGGSAPVTVEVRTEASALASGGMPSRYDFRGQPQPEGSIDRAGLLTTVQLPLGEWITVASDGGSDRRSERGVLSSAEIARDRRYVVQMRVTLP